MNIEIKSTGNGIEMNCKGTSQDIIPALCNIAIVCMTKSHEILCHTDDVKLADKIMQRTMEKAYQLSHEEC